MTRLVHLLVIGMVALSGPGWAQIVKRDDLVGTWVSTKYIAPDQPTATVPRIVEHILTLRGEMRKPRVVFTTVDRLPHP